MTNQARLLIGRNRHTVGLYDSVLKGFRGPESFILLRKGQDIVLVGSGDRGTLYAVYEFLSKVVGVRWFAPGDIGEEIPRVRSISVGDLNCVDQPAFTYRFFRYLYIENLSLEQRRELQEWMARNRCNFNLLDPQRPVSRADFAHEEAGENRGGHYVGMIRHNFYKIIPAEEY
jgi:hypothetical protein